jgi:hypothetical protein
MDSEFQNLVLKRNMREGLIREAQNINKLFLSKPTPQAVRIPAFSPRRAFHVIYDVRPTDTGAGDSLSMLGFPINHGRLFSQYVGFPYQSWQVILSVGRVSLSIMAGYSLAMSGSPSNHSRLISRYVGFPYQS